MDCIINISAFQDEWKENYIPHFDVYNHCYNTHEHHHSSNKSSLSAKEDHDDQIMEEDCDEDANRAKAKDFRDITFVLVRSAYLLVNVDVKKLLNPNEGPQIMSTPEYHKACE